MEYTILGKTGVKVSRIGFGAAPIGLTNYLENYDPVHNPADRDKALKSLHRAYELGINYFDNAFFYGKGLAEEMFGEVFSSKPYDDIFVATKIQIRKGQDVRRSVEEALKRLKRNRIDLMQVHGGIRNQEEYDFVMNENGMVTALQQLQKEGLIRFIGITSEDNNDYLYRCIQSGKFDVIQLCYNLIFQHPYEPSRPFGSMLEAEKMNMGIVTMRTSTSNIFQKWIRMVNPSNTFDYTPSLIQFVLSNPYVDSALIGMRDPEIVEKNVEICNDLQHRIDLLKLFQRTV